MTERVTTFSTKTNKLNHSDLKFPLTGFCLTLSSVPDLKRPFVKAVLTTAAKSPRYDGPFKKDLDVFPLNVELILLLSSIT